MKHRCWVVTVALVVLLPLLARAAEPVVLGARPGYAAGPLAEVPNAAAIQARIWAPGLEDGYVPQGLALAEGSILIGAYRSTERGQDTGPCRVYRLDAASGQVAGQFDVPPDCGHAGGLAYAGGNVLYVVDTHVVLAVDLARAFRDGHAEAALEQRLHLKGDVRGSLSTYHGDSLWIGSWNPALPGALFRFPRAALQALGAEADLGPALATARLELPPKAQGAAFDGQGQLWVTLSNTRRGQLVRLDPTTGRVLAEYEISPGAEGIAFASPTRLWAVAEVGSRRWLAGIPFHPLVFALDPAELK